MSTATNTEESGKRRTLGRELLARAIPSALRNLFRVSCKTPRTDSDVSDVVIDNKAPGKVKIGNGEFLQLGLEPGPDGDTLEIARRSFQSERAVVKIQAAFRRYKARALFKSLQTIDKMNLEIKWPDAIPFIGLLIIRVNSIQNLQGVRTALLRTKFDGDVSINIPGFKNKEGIINYDHRATFINVAVRSNSVLTIEVIQSLELAVRVLGKVHLPISMISQGTGVRNEDIRSSGGDVVGVMNLAIGYHWMRNTTDYGGYDGPEILVMPSRKIRGTLPSQAVERLWKVNHWVCSHDNVWCSTPDFADIVREAVRREKNKSSSLVVYDEAGDYKDVDALPKTLKFHDVFGNPDRPDLSSTELLHQTAGTADWKKVEPFESVSTSGSGSSMIEATSLGNEDWRSALDDFTTSQRSDVTSSSIVEEEVNFDYSHTPMELIEQDESDESSASSETPPTSPISPTSPTSGLRKPYPVDRVAKFMANKHASKRERPTVPTITGKFEYGVYRPASKRGVHLFARKVDNSVESGIAGVSNVSYMGEHRTSKRGRLHYPMPHSIVCVPGLYNVLALLPDDNTFGHGSVFLLEKGTKCVVFDLDGTITTSDVHVVAQTILDSVSASTVIGASIGRSYDIKARPSALMCVRAWAAKGYQVIYLSGRQGSAYNMTLEWLIKHGYPPGPIHLTRTHMPTLPVYVSVGHFKIKYMEELKAKGLELYAAYGNTGTDIKAYENVGIPKERTFIVGPHGGKKNTRAVKDFTTHLPQILLFPDSDKPLPYTELLRTSPSQTLDF